MLPPDTNASGTAVLYDIVEMIKDSSKFEVQYAVVAAVLSGIYHRNQVSQR